MAVKLSDSQIQALQARVAELEADNQRLRQSEANFRTLFELSNEGIYYAEVDPPCPINLSVDEQCDWVYNNLRLVRVNPAFAAMYGADHPDQLLGLMNADVHVEDSEKNAAFIRGIVESGYCFRNLETEEVDQLGQPRFFLNGGIGIVEQGYFVGGWGTQADITELRQAQQSLLEAEQAKSQELESLNTELRQTLTELEGRDRISAATAAGTNVLLTIDRLDDAIDSALQIIGTALDIDRVAVLEHFFPTADSSLAHWRVLYEWDAPEVISQIDNPHTTQGTYEGIEEWYELLSQGKALSYLLEDMPEPFRNGQREIGVKALHGVPIMIDGQFWGTVGIDNCREAKRISEAELSILKVAADCIGSAIQRDRTQRSLQQAEQARIAELARNEVLIQRDRMLNASATSVSALLTVEDLDEAINQVLKTVGEAIDTDRAGIVEFFYPDENSSAGLPHWRLLHEWHTLNTPSQLADPIANQGTHDGIEDIYARLEQGNFFSTAIEDCGEPFRTQQMAIGVQAIHYVPIFVESECWGLLGFDDCHKVKHRSPAELSILSVA
ncbi:MAG: GAF domain-containing protein, partial [Cyanobacteria bacterium P01_F01_bin.86]